ncbi:MutS-related protein [Clostridium cellulovorans]|uniref:DNA mismatch repair protein MutS domain protein n=1 Tax=Clostridium cellulovorans (strain ATCC 35296 / DSM 3052 / OCM 3 / 743B) TaxID=573061 RepID=D9SQ45_CLOC7|nr:DNA mismatch repair protein MutS [Clostridium cellulovorans]ADL52181.1 DNA mismatch repair protein MutS domain protein [Clostridium cellulovorans 743B]
MTNDSMIKTRIQLKLEHDEEKKVDFTQISSLSDNSEKEENYIDDLTFNDLNLKNIFKKIDKTFTTPGQEVLYHMLRRPLIDKEKLEARKKIIDSFEKNQKASDDVAETLFKLDKTFANSKSILWSEFQDSELLSVVSKALAITPIIWIILGIVLMAPSYAFLFFANLIVNSILNMKIENALMGRTKIAGYLAETIKTAERIADLNLEFLGDYNSNLKELTKSCRGVKRAGRLLTKIIKFNELLDIFNNIFVLEVNCYFVIMKQLKSRKEELRQIYYIVGEIDTILSISNFRKMQSNISDPMFVEEKYLKMTDMVHPLIKEPISNNVVLDNHGIMITGSNMSGKSTFLRTVGINALLAQTILTTFSKEYKGSIFYISSSISPEDSIVEGKSYYLGEAEGILRIVNKSKLKVPTLAMIDEIFRGTNPVERISAAANISNYLVENNALPLIATHDLELTKMVNNFKFFYLKEDVKDGGMTFDYKLREGISPTRNAIKLLKMLGYPKIIIDTTEEQIKHYK